MNSLSRLFHSSYFLALLSLYYKCSDNKDNDCFAKIRQVRNENSFSKHEVNKRVVFIIIKASESLVNIIISFS